jgi:hypothetical protein
MRTGRNKVRIDVPGDMSEKTASHAVGRVLPIVRKIAAVLSWSGAATLHCRPPTPSSIAATPAK